MLYFIAAVFGFVLAYIIIKSQSSMEDTLMYHLSKGKRVIVTIDNDAYIFEKIGTKLRVTKGVLDYNPEPIDLGETNDDSMDTRDVN